MIQYRHLAAATAVVALGAQASFAAAPSALRGEQLVARNCTQCHAVDRPGGSPDSAAPPLHTLYKYVKMSDLAEALRRGLLAKHPSMPEFRFSAAEINAIIEYLRSIQEQPEPISGPAK